MQTKSAMHNLVNWVQLQIYFEETTQQKKPGVILNEKYSDGLMSLKKWFDYIESFQRTKEEMAKKRPNQPKIAVFRLLVNEYPIEINCKLAIKTSLLGGMKTYNRSSVRGQKWPPHKVTTS